MQCQLLLINPKIIPIANIVLFAGHKITFDSCNMGMNGVKCVLVKN